jgi:hypothetical protein
MREQYALVAHLTPILAAPSTGGVLWVHMEEFRSKSEALQYLECGVERGQYQACGNLKLTEQMDFRGRTYLHTVGRRALGFTIPIVPWRARTVLKGATSF